jgi:decaprenyl-phosphate phosphoribosyltransferase
VATPADAVEPQDDSRPDPESSSFRAVILGMARMARPRQWIKNLLVFVAPGAAGVLTHGDSFAKALGAFGIFCLAASGTYFLNDTIDADRDRLHPTKRYRPVASGIVSPQLAVGAGVVLLAVSFALAWLLAGYRLALVVGLYVAITTVYSLWLKHEPIVDLVAVSSGFVLRAIAGGIATGVVLSDWFLIVASFGSLLIVTGKRSGEQKLLGANQAQIRQTLGRYDPSFLQTVRTLSAAVTVTAYCLWAFDRAVAIHPGHHPIWFQLSIVPFVLGLLHVVRQLDAGHGSTPEDMALGDRRLQIYGVTWVALIVVGVYA